MDHRNLCIRCCLEMPFALYFHFLLYDSTFFFFFLFSFFQLLFSFLFFTFSLRHLFPVLARAGYIITFL